MKKELQEIYDEKMHNFYYYRRHINRVIESCKTEAQLENTLKWALGIWSRQKLIIQQMYDKVALYYKPQWLDLKMNLEFRCNQTLFQEVIDKVVEQKKIINTHQS